MRAVLLRPRVYYIDITEREWGLASRTFSLERVADEECIHVAQ
jgi:hypothetical protein